MKIKEYFQSLVKAGIIPQEPANYDAETLKIYIDHLESENAALHERLEKAVEIGDTVFYIAQYCEDMYEIVKMKVDGKNAVHCINNIGHVFVKQEEIGKKLFLTREAAEARLVELKGEQL